MESLFIAIYKLNKINKIEQKFNRDDLIYKTENKEKEKTYDFQKFYNKIFWKRYLLDNIKLYDAREEQINIKYDIDNSNNLWDQKKKKRNKKSTDC